MPGNVPDEVVVARLSIEAARIALESLFEKMNVMPRSQKMIVTEHVNEACLRLKAAQVLLQKLEAVTAAGPDEADELTESDKPADSDEITKPGQPG